MRKFLLKLLKLKCCLIIIFVLFCLLNKYISKKILDVELQTLDNKSILAIGHSHIANSLSPDYIDSFANKAFSADAYCFSKLKIAYYLEENRSIKTVILPFSYFDFVIDGIHPDTAYNKSRSLYYSPLISSYQKYADFIDELICSDIYKRERIKELLGFPDKYRIDRTFAYIFKSVRKPDFYEGFRSYERSTLSNWNDAQKAMIDFGSDYKNAQMINDSISINQREFKNIMSYLSKRDINIVLYTAPCHKTYTERLSKKLIKQLDSLAEYCKKEYTNVYYINHCNLNMPDSCYRDYEHTNVYGARIASKLLNDTLLKLNLHK